MCIWKVNKEDRMCDFCSYIDGCERRPRVLWPSGAAGVYMKAMFEVSDINVLEVSRKKKVVWARNMVVYKLCMSGMSLAAVGEYFGMDHSSVWYCKHQVKTMLSCPLMYRDEMELWNKFNEQLEYEDLGQNR